MIPQDKLRKVAERLFEKSRKNQVLWRHYGDDCFKVVVGQGAVTVEYFSPPTDPDYVSLQVFGPGTNVPVGEWIAAKPAGEDNTAESVAGWTLLLSLFNEAKRIVTGWDAVLTDIENALSSDDVVGDEPPRSSAEPSEDDIPF